MIISSFSDSDRNSTARHTLCVYMRKKSRKHTRKEEAVVEMCWISLFDGRGKSLAKMTSGSRTLNKGLLEA